MSMEEKEMKVFFLGQAGFLFIKNGFKIMIDPYLSNSVEKINPKNYRRVGIDEKIFDIDFLLAHWIGDVRVR